MNDVGYKMKKKDQFRRYAVWKETNMEDKSMWCKGSYLVTNT